MVKGKKNSRGGSTLKTVAKALGGVKGLVAAHTFNKATRQIERSIGKKATRKVRTKMASGMKLMSRLAGKAIQKITGSGDYEVSNDNLTTNSLVHGKVGLGARFGETSDTIRIQNVEYISEITTPNTPAFTVLSFDLNPLNTQLFPWLSNIAPLYSKFCIRGMWLEFVSEVSSYSSQPAMGAIGATMNPDPSDPVFANRMEAENSSHCVSVRPDKSFAYALECDKKHRFTEWLYVSQNSGQKNTWSQGTLQFFTNTPLTSVNIGYLRVVYDIELTEPVLTTATGYAHFRRTGANTTSPLGTGPYISNAPSVVQSGSLSRSSIQGGNQFQIPIPSGHTIKVDMVWQANNVPLANIQSPSFASSGNALTFLRCKSAYEFTSQYNSYNLNSDNPAYAGAPNAGGATAYNTVMLTMFITTDGSDIFTAPAALTISATGVFPASGLLDVYMYDMGLAQAPGAAYNTAGIVY